MREVMKAGLSSVFQIFINKSIYKRKVVLN